MIPTDLSTRLRLIQDSQIQAPTAAAEIPGELPAFAAGQRITARIAAVQGNGVFRAEVEGKMLNLTVSSSNLGKPVEQLRGIGVGQTLDLVVTGRSGRNILARLPDQPPADAPVLSRSAQIIGSLLARGTPEAAPLAKGAPLMQATSSEAFHALPQQLRQAVSESGLFYESHQAQWLAGQLPATTLLKEPQGSLSPLLNNPENTAPAVHAGTAFPLATASARNPPAAAEVLPSAGTVPGEGSVPGATTFPAPVLQSAAAGTATGPLTSSATSPLPQDAADLARISGTSLRLIQGTLFYQAEPDRSAGDTPSPEAGNPERKVAARTAGVTGDPGHAAERPQPGSRAAAAEYAAVQAAMRRGEQGQAATTVTALSAGQGPATTLPSELQPLVQQQLDAADSRQLFWQGQIWPGQDMEWRIRQEQSRGGGTEEEEQPHWQTSLRLTLPQLGQLNASLTLNPSGVAITVATDQGETLRRAAPELASSLEAAGVPVLSLSVVPNEPA